MRSKEDAHDYRYFPDPDLPPLIITPAWIAQVKDSMPELPKERRHRFVEDLGLSSEDAAQLCQDRQIAQYFEAVANALPNGQAKLAANWVMGEVAAALNREEKDIDACPLSAGALAKLLARISDGTISNKIAREIFTDMWANSTLDADAIIEAKGLKQISDSSAIGAMVDEVIASQPAIVQEYRAGKQKAFNSLVGQVMKLAKGKANPAQVNDLLKQRLDG
jgi:aspartyl-tRNA(Asn)/glutamyl-tRNA(Gln) amidotransferase subunit B